MNRHSQALAEHLIERGNEVKVLAPWDPPDRLSRTLHRGAPPRRRPMPDYLIPLGPDGRAGGQRRGLQRHRLPRRRHDDAQGAAGRGLRRRPRAGAALPDPRLGRLLVPGRPGRRHLPCLRAELLHQQHGERLRRPPQVQPAERQDRRLGGGRVDRPALVRGQLRGDSQRRRPRCRRGRRHAAADESELRLLFVGRDEARKGLPVLLRAFEALAQHVPARLVVVGTAPRRSRGPCRSRVRCVRSTRSARSAAIGSGASSPPPTCSARPRSPARASGWS